MILPMTQYTTGIAKAMIDMKNCLMVSYWEPGPVPNFRDEGSSENRTRLKSGITKFAVRERGPTGAPLRSVEPTHS